MGVVPAYTLVDVSGGWSASRAVRVTGGVSNLLNRQYFTKRPQFYPRPGVGPSDGRSVYLSLEINPR